MFTYRYRGAVGYLTTKVGEGAIMGNTRPILFSIDCFETEISETRFLVVHFAKSTNYSKTNRRRFEKLFVRDLILKNWIKILCRFIESDAKNNIVPVFVFLFWIVLSINCSRAKFVAIILVVWSFLYDFLLDRFLSSPFDFLSSKME